MSTTIGTPREAMMPQGAHGSCVLVHSLLRLIVNWVRPGSLLASAGGGLVRLHASVVHFWQPPVVNHRHKESELEHVIVFWLILHGFLHR